MNNQRTLIKPIASFAAVLLLVAALAAATSMTVNAASSKPGAPTNLSGVYESAGVTLTWGAPQGDVTGYQVLRRRPSEGGKSLLVQIDDTGNTDTEWTDTDIVIGMKYIYRVKAINGSRTGKISNVFKITVEEPVPGRPEDLSAQAEGESVVLAWTAPAGDITGYQILRRSPSLDETTLTVYEEDTSSTETTWTDDGIEENQRYVYRVAAINTHGVGDYSRPASGSVGEFPEEAEEASASTSVIIMFGGPSHIYHGGTAEIWVNVNYLQMDSDETTLDAVVRIDAETSDGQAADYCESAGMGTNRKLYVVDEDPEVFVITFGGGGCVQGDYQMVVEVSDGAEASLGGVTMSMRVAGQGSARVDGE